MRAVCSWTAPRTPGRGARGARRWCAAARVRAPRWTGRGLARMAARIDKAAFTRADMVELVGAQLPVDAPGDPRALIEELVDAVSVYGGSALSAGQRITGEGYEKFTVDAGGDRKEEERVLRDGRRGRQRGAA